jgi:hypothetical protein
MLEPIGSVGGFLSIRVQPESLDETSGRVKNPKRSEGSPRYKGAAPMKAEIRPAFKTAAGVETVGYRRAGG